MASLLGDFMKILEREDIKNQVQSFCRPMIDGLLQEVNIYIYLILLLLFLNVVLNISVMIFVLKTKTTTDLYIKDHVV